MNSREQWLQKRNERLEDLVAFLRADLDFTESVGAAFAFDLGMMSADRSYVGTGYFTIDLLISWDEAIKAAREAANGSL